jgi:hypothetical protein
MSYILLVGGFLMCIFRKQFAKSAMKNQNRTWGFRFGEEKVKIAEVFAFLAGLGFMIISLLDIFGVIHIRKSF